jgi:hypothetical protein
VRRKQRVLSCQFKVWKKRVKRSAADVALFVVEDNVTLPFVGGGALRFVQGKRELMGDLVLRCCSIWIADQVGKGVKRGGRKLFGKTQNPKASQVKRVEPNSDKSLVLSFGMNPKNTGSSLGYREQEQRS